MTGILKPDRGYTHVQDFTILSDRVKQLELALSKAISRLDDSSKYTEILGSNQWVCGVVDG